MTEYHCYFTLADHVWIKVLMHLDLSRASERTLEDACEKYAKATGTRFLYFEEAAAAP